MTRPTKWKIGWRRGKNHTSPVTLGERHKDITQIIFIWFTKSFCHQSNYENKNKWMNLLQDTKLLVMPQLAPSFVSQLTSKTTETSFFVVLAEVWLVVPSHRRPDVVRSPDGPFAPHTATSSAPCSSVLFLIKLTVVIETLVNLVISLTQLLLQQTNAKLNESLKIKIMEREGNNLQSILDHLILSQ